MLFCLQVAHSPSGTRLRGCVQAEASRFFGLVEDADDLVQVLHLHPAGADLLGPSFPPAIALLPLAEMLHPDRRNSVHPCELCTCTSTAESALEKGSRKDVTRSRTGLLLSCFHKWQNHRFMSFLQSPRSVRVTMENSPHFQLVGSNDAYRRVPAGARHIMRIRFTPDENKVRLEERYLQSHCFPCTLGTAHSML